MAAAKAEAKHRVQVLDKDSLEWSTEEEVAAEREAQDAAEHMCKASPDLSVRVVGPSGKVLWRSISSADLAAVKKAGMEVNGAEHVRDEPRSVEERPDEPAEAPKPARRPRRVKSAKEKQAKQGGRAKAFGEYHAGPLCRWMGRHGWTREEAVFACGKLGLAISEQSVAWELKERREGRDPAKPSKEHAVELGQIREMARLKSDK